MERSRGVRFGSNPRHVLLWCKRLDTRVAPDDTRYSGDLLSDFGVTKKMTVGVTTCAIGPTPCTESSARRSAKVNLATARAIDVSVSQQAPMRSLWYEALSRSNHKRVEKFLPSHHASAFGDRYGTGSQAQLLSRTCARKVQRSLCSFFG